MHSGPLQHFDVSLQTSIRILIQALAPSDVSYQNYRDEKPLRVLSPQEEQDNPELILILKEEKDYRELILILKAIEKTLLDSYTEAQRRIDTLTLEYLGLVGTTLAQTLSTLINLNTPIAVKMQAIDQLIKAAKPKPGVVEAAEPVITPLCAVIGAVVGFVVGAPLGAVVGLVVGIGCMLSSNGGPSDAQFLAYFLAACAFLGACAGAFYGATTLAKNLWTLSHNTFFKPSSTQDQVRKAFTSNTLKRFLGRQQIESQIQATDNPTGETPNLIYDLQAIVTSYVHPTDKEQALTSTLRP